ncbi:MAG: acyl-CoA dehydrogenase family protein, partial [Leeuwenhoekiella sp.]
IRFAAVQLGGAEAFANVTLEHLKKQERVEDTYQQTRIAKIAMLLESGRLWIEAAGKLADTTDESSSAELVNYANMVRTAIMDICNEVIKLSERSVGLQGFMQDHPMEKLHRDLTTYLKQPGPDYALANIGKFTAQLKDMNHVK